MNGANEFGNTPWYVFVTAGYAVVGVCLLTYAIFSALSLKKTLKSLKDEGFVNDEGKKL
jgi:hypothetical protein